MQRGASPTAGKPDILADLAVAHCDVGCNAIVPGSAQPTQFTKPENLAMWTLFNVATISPTTRTRLCLHAKAGSRDPALIHFIDSVGGEIRGEVTPPMAGVGRIAWPLVSL